MHHDQAAKSEVGLLGVDHDERASDFAQFLFHLFLNVIMRDISEEHENFPFRGPDDQLGFIGLSLGPTYRNKK